MAEPTNLSLVDSLLLVAVGSSLAWWLGRHQGRAELVFSRKLDAYASLYSALVEAQKAVLAFHLGMTPIKSCLEKIDKLGVAFASALFYMLPVVSEKAVSLLEPIVEFEQSFATTEGYAISTREMPTYDEKFSKFMATAKKLELILQKDLGMEKINKSFYRE